MTPTSRNFFLFKMPFSSCRLLVSLLAELTLGISFLTRTGCCPVAPTDLNYWFRSFMDEMNQTASWMRLCFESITLKSGSSLKFWGYYWMLLEPPPVHCCLTSLGCALLCWAHLHSTGPLEKYNVRFSVLRFPEISRNTKRYFCSL